jgi:hypothetical protein
VPPPAGLGAWAAARRGLTQQAGDGAGSQSWDPAGGGRRCTGEAALAPPPLFHPRRGNSVPAEWEPLPATKRPAAHSRRIPLRLGSGSGSAPRG